MNRQIAAVFPAFLPKCPRFALLWLGLGGHLAAHPIPDIPVRGFFEADATARIEIEIDPRIFAKDPVEEPYLTKAGLEKLPAGQRAELVEKARKHAADAVAFFFEPTSQFLPQFEFGFTKPGGAELKGPDDSVMLTGRWTTKLPAGATGFWIGAAPEGKLNVMLMNTVNGRPARVNVLFPGERSHVLDLTNRGEGRGDGGMGATFAEFVRQGFAHVIPLGWDHILFVLGLFLLSRQWRPLLGQVTMFTAAHTLTLGLATLGGLSVPGRWVEPVIAVSIAVIAIENVFRPKYSRWRLAVVFVFGMVHGLGFAGALQDLNLPAPSLVIGLLGFNAGVECGQLAVIGTALLVTSWLKKEEVYRKLVAVPASIAIAGFGLWWTVERIVGQ